MSARAIREALTVHECIVRGLMPQVDEADIPDLVAFLRSRGIRVTRHAVSPRGLRRVQRIVLGKVRNIARAEEEILGKPVLVSVDRYVVDGNHRVAAAIIRRVTVPILLFNRPFAEVVEDIFAFPRTYAYGDGRFHPVRN
jgi:hypothetical protein